MKRAMTRVPEQITRNESEWRAFYQSLGMSPETTELAIQMRRKKPVQVERNAMVRKRVDAFRASMRSSS